MVMGPSLIAVMMVMGPSLITVPFFIYQSHDGMRAPSPRTGTVAEVQDRSRFPTCSISGVFLHS